ncbi:hypothetical protein ACQ4PT_056399 [Festuca glaucescens]
MDPAAEVSHRMLGAASPPPAEEAAGVEIAQFGVPAAAGEAENPPAVSPLLTEGNGDAVLAKRQDAAAPAAGEANMEVDDAPLSSKGAERQAATESKAELDGVSLLEKQQDVVAPAVTESKMEVDGISASEKEHAAAVVAPSDVRMEDPVAEVSHRMLGGVEIAQVGVPAMVGEAENNPAVPPLLTEGNEDAVLDKQHGRAAPTVSRANMDVDEAPSPQGKANGCGVLMKRQDVTAPTVTESKMEVDDSSATKQEHAMAVAPSEARMEEGGNREDHQHPNTSDGGPPAKENEEGGCFVGRYISRRPSGDGATRLGKVASYDASIGLYNVVFEDGQGDEFALPQLRELLMDDENGASAMKVSRRKRKLDPLVSTGSVKQAKGPPSTRQRVDACEVPARPDVTQQTGCDPDLSGNVKPSSNSSDFAKALPAELDLLVSPGTVKQAKGPPTTRQRVDACEVPARPDVSQQTVCDPDLSANAKSSSNPTDFAKELPAELSPPLQGPELPPSSADPPAKDNEEGGCFVGRYITRSALGDGATRLGKVASYDASIGVYNVVFEDGQGEDLALPQLRELLMDDDNGASAMKVSRRKRKLDLLVSTGTVKQAKGPPSTRQRVDACEMPARPDVTQQAGCDLDLSGNVKPSSNSSDLAKALPAELDLLVSPGTVKQAKGPPTTRQRVDACEVPARPDASQQTVCDLDLSGTVKPSSNSSDFAKALPAELDLLVSPGTVKQAKGPPTTRQRVDACEVLARPDASQQTVCDPDPANAKSSSNPTDFAKELPAELSPPLQGPELPPSSADIAVPEESISHLFSVYTFLRSFNVQLFLSPFGLDDFVASINCTVQNTLLDAVHVSLLRALRRHLETKSSRGSELASNCLRIGMSMDTGSYARYYNQYDVAKLESNIRSVAFSPSWVKLLDDWPVESPAPSAGTSHPAAYQKRGTGGRRGRKRSLATESAAVTDNGKSWKKVIVTMSAHTNARHILPQKKSTGQLPVSAPKIVFKVSSSISAEPAVTDQAQPIAKAEVHPVAKPWSSFSVAALRARPKIEAWFHGDALRLEEERILDVVEYRCCRCRRQAIPTCPHSDDFEPEFSEQTVATSSQSSMLCSEDTGSYGIFEPTGEEIFDADLSMNVARFTPGTNQKLSIRRPQGKTSGHVDQPPADANVNFSHMDKFSLSELDGVDASELPAWDHSQGSQWNEASRGSSATETSSPFTDLLEAEDARFANTFGMPSGMQDNCNYTGRFVSREPVSIDDVDVMIEDGSSNMHFPANEPPPDKAPCIKCSGLSAASLILKCSVCGLHIHRQCSPWDENDLPSESADWPVCACREWR